MNKFVFSFPCSSRTCIRSMWVTKCWLANNKTERDGCTETDTHTHKQVITYTIIYCVTVFTKQRFLNVNKFRNNFFELRNQNECGGDHKNNLPSADCFSINDSTHL